MFAAVSPNAGTQPFNDWFAPDTVQRQPLGEVVTAVDPFWGTGKFVYLKSNDAVLKGSLVMWDETYLAALLPNTANQGFPFAVAMAPAASGTFFWAQVEGRCVYKTNATVAADAAIGIGAAGIAGTNSAGKQLLNTRNRVAATGTKTFTVNTQNGTGVLYAPSGYDGAFLGMALSGTGIPASTVVAALDPDGKRIYTGSAIGTLGDKNSTATGSITLTGTYTGFGSAIINNPFAQGAIT
jgi:hypothetical protein